jgi:hypothetical protein
MVTCRNGVGIYRDGTSAIMSRSVMETKFYIQNNVNELISKGAFNICFHFNYSNWNSDSNNYKQVEFEMTISGVEKSYT